MHKIYNSEMWCLFDLFMKVMLNQAAYKERPFKRNLAFNFYRCFAPEFLTYTVFEKFSPTPVLILHAVAITFFTWIVQSNCTKKTFKRNADEWVALKVFYMVSYGIIFLDLVT